MFLNIACGQMDTGKAYVLSPGTDVATLDDTGTYLSYRGKTHFFRGSMINVIVAALDGEHTCEEIAESFESLISRTEAYYTLRQLDAKGLIKPSEKHSDLLPLYGEIPNSFQSTSGRMLQRFYLHVTSKPAVEIDELGFLSDQFGFSKTRGDADYVVNLLLCERYLDIEDNDALGHLSGKDCFLFPVKLSGNILWFGPLLKPEGSPCLSCLTNRLHFNRPLYSYRRADVSSARNPSLPKPMVTTALTLTVLQLSIALSTGSKHDVWRNVTCVDLSSLTHTKHEVRALPQCAKCGDANTARGRMGEPIRLGQSPRTHQDQGGYRAVAPTETWERYRHLVSPISGVVFDLKPFREKENENRLRPVYQAVYPVHPPAGQRLANEPFLRPSFGKGTTDQQARVSALCEALERVAAEFRGDEPLTKGTLREHSSDAVDPRELLLFSTIQYESPSNDSRTNSPQWVPAEFSDDMVIDWVPAWSLTHSRYRLLPAGYCFYHMPLEIDKHVCAFSSNGNAAGNTLEEAILQGFLELVERDAVGIWWYNRLQFPGLDFDGWGDSYLSEIQQRYADIDWQLWALDVTHDLGIPAVVAVARNEKTRGYIVGMGCHLNARLAFQRAVTEVNQVLARTKLHPFLWAEEEFDSVDYLFPSTSMAKRSEKDYPSVPNRSLGDDVAWCVDRARRNNLEVIVLDYTRVDIGMATVKVVVPGLRHIWPRFGPGRLYDVPIQMGWKDTPFEESQMNPIPLIV